MTGIEHLRTGKAARGYRLSSTSYVVSCFIFFLLALLVFFGFFRESRKSLEERFHVDALRRVQVVQNLLHRSLGYMEILGNYFAASENVTIDEFTAFTRSWMDSGTFRLLGQISSSGGGEDIRLMLPPEQESFRFTPAQQADLRRAREEQHCTVSDIPGGEQGSILMFFPLNSSDGILFAIFTIRDLTEAALSSVSAPGLPFRILSEPGNDQALLYRYGDTPAEQKRRIPLYPADTSLTHSQLFPFTDQTWEIVIRAAPGYIRNNSSIMPWLVLAGGIVLSVLLSVYLYQRALHKRIFASKVEELDRFFTLALDMLCIADTTGVFVRLNPEWERSLGYPAEFLLGKNIFDFIHPEDVSSTEEAVKVLAQGDMVAGFVNRYRCADGTYTWIEWRSVARDDHIYAAARDITDHRRWEQQLLDSLAEKEILIKEIHHRVKNNLQIVTSMLNLEMERIPDRSARELLLRNQHRINTIAMVHEILYTSETLSRVNLAVHFGDLVSQYRQTASGRDITYTLDVSEELLPLDLALPCGLMVNEILTNSIQHALGGCEDPRVDITFLRQNNNGLYLLTVADNGPGLPPEADLKKPPGLGFTLLSALAEQIGGNLVLGEGPGAVFRISFPAPDTPPECIKTLTNLS